MNPIGHSLFIKTPLSTVIEDTSRACMSLGTGIEVHPLASYIMQTTFLRMTGASEQKLKCICWEVASFDYEFRYEMLRNPLGECSSHQDKKTIFKNLCESLKRFESSPEISIADKNTIIQNSTTGLQKSLECSALSRIFEKEFKIFKQFCGSNSIKPTLFCNPSGDNLSFLEKELKEYYEDHVYRQRNRYAHNLMSYQMNIPTLSQLAKADSEKSNHFRMMSVLILLDEIFMNLFKKFELVRNNHGY